MENSSKTIIIITILILSLVIFYQVFVLAKTITLENQKNYAYDLFLVEQQNKLIETKINYGDYKIIYSSQSKTNNKSVLKLYQNATFYLDADVCGAIVSYKGLYIIEKDILTLMNVNNECTKYKNCDLKEFSLIILNKTKLKLESNTGCLSKNSIFAFQQVLPLNS